MWRMIWANRQLKYLTYHLYPYSQEEGSVLWVCVSEQLQVHSIMVFSPPLVSELQFDEQRCSSSHRLRTEAPGWRKDLLKNSNECKAESFNCHQMNVTIQTGLTDDQWNIIYLYVLLGNMYLCIWKEAICLNSKLQFGFKLKKFYALKHS